MEIAGQQVPAMSPASAQLAIERARAAAAGLRAQTAAGAQLTSGASATTAAPVNAQIPVSVPRPGTAAAPQPANGAAAAATPQAQQQAAIQAQQQAAAEQEVRFPRLKLRRNATIRDVLVAIAGAMDDPGTSKAGAARLQALHEQLLDVQRQSMSLWTRGY